MKQSVRKQKTISFTFNVTKADIEQGDCLKPERCMIRVALERKLREIDPHEKNHHSRVDGGICDSI